MFRAFLKWQDRQMAGLSVVTTIVVFTGVGFIIGGWRPLTTAVIVGWCVGMALFIAVNAVGWVVVLSRTSVKK